MYVYKSTVAVLLCVRIHEITYSGKTAVYFLRRCID